METDADQKPEVMEEGDVDVMRISKQYEDAVNDFSNYQNLQTRNYDTRHTRWPGQTDDQRKNGPNAFPWKGASDLKVPLVDEIINWCVALDVMGLQRANVRAFAVGMDDLQAAAIVGNFMKWMLLSQMEEMPDQSELISQYRHERGLAIGKVYWEKHEQKVQQTLKLADLAAAQPDVAQAIQSGQFDEPLAEMLRTGFEAQRITFSKRRALRMVAELREKGETTVPRIVGVVNRPCIKALAPGEDIFFPVNTRDIQTASAIFERVYYSPATLRAVGAANGWDMGYVEYIAEHCVGKNGAGSDFEDIEHRYQTERMSYGGSTTGIRDGLVELVYAYQRMSDEDGVLGVYLTVFCPVAKGKDGYGEDYAFHSLMPFKSGKYPFVAFKREILSPCLLDSRGVAETGAGWQDAVKTEMDGRTDNASLTIAPPRYHPPGREPTKWGAGISVPVRRPGEYGYLPTPPFPNASVEVQAMLVKMVRQFYGRVTDQLDMPEATVRQQKQVNDFLRPWQTVFNMVWELYQEYGPDEEFFRVAGIPQEKATKFRKSDFSAKYDFKLGFDVLNLDPETAMTKLEKIATLAAQHDRQGQTKWGEMLARLLSAIDPLASEELLMPAETASNKEISETQNDIAKMVAGIDLDAPQNANVQLRSQVLEQWKTGPTDNPSQDVAMMLSGNPNLQKRIDRYSEQLKFQATQQQNAIIGRVGTTPANN